ncbi:MAG: hypothetical protein PV340_05700 [Wolbachia sp.]|nr:hypothetical protein [Wolbachia sp.]MDD9336023.1 hypothetical protein [Wolbachia sp.]
MADDRVSLILEAIKASDIRTVIDYLGGKENHVNSGDHEVLDTHDYITLLHAALKQAKPSHEIINEVIKRAKEHKNAKKQNKINTNGVANGIRNHNNETEKSLIYKIVNSRSEDETKSTPLQVALEKRNPKKKIIKLLLESGADSNVKDSNGETALCLAIKNIELWNALSSEVKSSLMEKLDIKYNYSGPLNDKKKIMHKEGDRYLHIAARARNIDAFICIFKRSIENNVHLLEYNEDHENPLHLAARSGILQAVVKKMFKHLEFTANIEIKKLGASIKKAEKAKSYTTTDLKKLIEIKEKLKNDKSYIVEALCSKYALNEKKKTPLDCVSKTEKEDVKKAAGIKDKLICNGKFYLFLCIVGSMSCAVALCVSLYLLFLTSQAFALSSIASMAFAGVTYLSFNACKEIYDSNKEGALVQDVEATQLSGDCVGVTS